MIPAKSKPETILDGFKRGAMLFLGDIASFNNFWLLTLTYFFGVGFSSLAMKIFNKSPSPLPQKAEASYWSNIDIGDKNIDSYYRPF